METTTEAINVSSKTDENQDRIEVETNLNTPDSNKKENEDTGSSHDTDEQSIACNVTTNSEPNLQTACENTDQTISSDSTGL